MILNDLLLNDFEWPSMQLLNDVEWPIMHLLNDFELHAIIE